MGLTSLSRRISPDLHSIAKDVEANQRRDAVAAISRLRLWGERAAQIALETAKQPVVEREDQFARIGRLERLGLADRDVASRLHRLRTAGNKAVHENAGDPETLAACVKAAQDLAEWLFKLRRRFQAKGNVDAAQAGVSFVSRLSWTTVVLAAPWALSQVIWDLAQHDKARPEDLWAAVAWACVSTLITLAFARRLFGRSQTGPRRTTAGLGMAFGPAAGWALMLIDGSNTFASFDIIVPLAVALVLQLYLLVALRPKRN